MQRCTEAAAPTDALPWVRAAVEASQHGTSQPRAHKHGQGGEYAGIVYRMIQYTHALNGGTFRKMLLHSARHWLADALLMRQEARIASGLEAPIQPGVGASWGYLGRAQIWCWQSQRAVFVHTCVACNT